MDQASRKSQVKSSEWSAHKRQAGRRRNFVMCLSYLRQKYEKEVLKLTMELQEVK